MEATNVENMKALAAGSTEENTSDFHPEEKYLLDLLNYALQCEPDAGQNRSAGEKPDAGQTVDYSKYPSAPGGVNLGKVLKLAKAHKVLSLLFDALEIQPMPEHMKRAYRADTQDIVTKNLRMLFLDKYLVGEFRKKEIPVLILKGAATASFYPVPEYRKSGDIDLLLLDESKLKEAIALMKKLGFPVAEKQLALHHVVFSCEEGFEIELHTALAEPFDNKEMNTFIAKKLTECKEQVKDYEVCYVQVPGLKEGYHAYELLLHMLQHFLRSGFGLKLLADWVVFWNHEIPVEEKELYLQLVKESGVKGFSDTVTKVCVDYLGLSEENVAFMDLHPGETKMFMQEILVAEEFGKSSKDRMVALRGNGLFDYVREFHHQMHLNFPKAGKIFLFWPVLWCITLFRFLRNNRKLRKTGAGEILKKAGERGKLIKSMKLFKR